MKNLKKFKDLVNEGFFDNPVFARFGSIIKDTMRSSVNTTSIKNETELEGTPEPGGSPAESPAGKGIPLDTDVSLDAEQYDSYGGKVGITDKGENAKLEQPSSGPIGNILNSAYANLNVPTRAIPGTDRGNLGCGAATAIMFYRATGYSLAGNTKVCLSTQTIYDELEAKSKEPMMLKISKNKRSISLKCFSTVATIALDLMPILRKNRKNLELPKCFLAKITMAL